MPLERGRDVLAVADVRPQRADRPPRLDQVRAREIDRGLDACCATGGGSVPASRCAACSCIRIAREALREVVVNVAREPVALFENRLAPLFDAAAARRAGCGAARARPAARSLRSARRATTGSRSRRRRGWTASIQPSVRPPSTSGVATIASHVHLRARTRESPPAGAHRRRRTRSVCAPARLVREEVLGQALARELLAAIGLARPSRPCAACRADPSRRPSTDRSAARRRRSATRRRCGSRSPRPSSWSSAPKKPSMSGSRTSRSSASLTTSVCMSARHSARRRSRDSRISAARSTSGSLEATSSGTREPCSGTSIAVVHVRTPSTEIIGQFVPSDVFRAVLMADRRIVQKYEIALVRAARLRIARMHDA